MDAACSLRGGSAVLELLRGLWPALRRRPVANTGQWWLLRLGLFELTRPKEVADDWCWIIDHTVQIGRMKCLLIVGIRLAAFQKLDRPLEHRDLQVMALEPVETSDGTVVCNQLKAACKKTGIVPRQLLSDEGTDLLSGYREFSSLYPETAICRDITHLAAKFLKHELGRDARWAEFYSAAGSAKQRLAQTSLAHLLPPTPRTKARYMNLEELVNWGRQTLRYIDDPTPVAGVLPDHAALEAKLDWLKEYREALAEWDATMRVIGTTCAYVRRHGYHAKAASELKKELAGHRQTPLSDRLAERLLGAVSEQSVAVKDGERMVGSSECLESLIGRGKRLEGQQSRSGFTKMILGMAAAVVEPAEDYIHRALTQVKTIDVRKWCKDHLGVSIQAQRRQALGVARQKTG